MWEVADRHFGNHIDTRLDTVTSLVEQSTGHNGNDNEEVSQLLAAHLARTLIVPVSATTATITVPNLTLSKENNDHRDSVVHAQDSVVHAQDISLEELSEDSLLSCS